jgi:hypothetical protein
MSVFLVSGAIHCFQIWVILICFGSVKRGPAGFSWLGLGGVEIWNAWLVGFSMFACNVCRRKKWGRKIKEVFRSL